MYKNIVVAVDLAHGDAGKALIKRAAALVDAGGVIHVLHVLEDVPAYIAAELPIDVHQRRTAEARVELGVLVKDTGIESKVEVRQGAAAAQILQFAEDGGADLVMIASHRPGLSDYFIGSTAARVVRHAQCSVLIVR